MAGPPQGPQGQQNQPGNPGQPGHQGPPGQPEAGAEAPGKDRREIPEQIVGAWQAWLLVCVLQAAHALTTLAINLLNPGALLDVAGVGGESGSAMPDLSPDQELLVLRGSAIMTMLLTLAFVGVFAFLAFRMRRGSKWARFALVVGSAYLFVQALVMVFGGMTVGPWAMAPVSLQLVDGALVIASATAAGAAMALVSGKAAMEYFGAGGRGSGSGPKDSGKDNRRGR